MKQYKYIVGVRCLTYNHASYITDTLKGFIEQQTTFPYVCVVVDDASTDGEQEVIKSFVNEHFDINNVNAENRETEYAYITCAPHKSNKNCSIVVLYLKYNHYQIKKNKLPYLSEWLDNSKYHALCEGDDYWIDPLKLQKQVDFLEANPGYSMSWHAHKVHYPDNSFSDVYRYNENMYIVSSRDLILGGGGFIATNSILYKGECIEEYPKWAQNAPIGDYPLVLVLLTKGKVSYMNDIMSVYRVGVHGSWTQRMAGDYKKQIYHLRDIYRMFVNFNKWSDYRYCSHIRKKIWRNIVQRLKVRIMFLLYKIHLI